MKPHYYSLNEYLRDTFNDKLYKLSLNGGMSCPNRDGSIDTRGCIFCSAGGSGDFAGDRLKNYKGDISSYDTSLLNQCINYRDVTQTIPDQIQSAKALIAGKYTSNSYIAYFQSYTNTYADTEYLRRLFYPVIKRDDIRILSIATRPDCIDDETIALLSQLNTIKPVWVELGLQTIHEPTASYIRRGYSLSAYDSAVKQLLSIGIKPIIHMIIGLPGETPDMMLQTADYIARSGAGGIKLQLLHVLKGTDLARDYCDGLFETLSLESYAQILGKIIESLPKDMVIHRITGDGPKNLLIAPLWSADKKNTLNYINRYMKNNNITQGRNYI